MRRHRLHEAPHVADLEREPPVAHGRIAGPVRRVVGDDVAVVPELVEDAHHRGHVELAFVGIHLGEPLERPGHVTEVDVADPAAPAEVANRVVDAVAVEHLRETAQTEHHRVVGARHQVEQPVVVGRAAQDARDAGQAGHLRIRRMHHHAHAGRFRHRDHRPQEIGQVVPHLPFPDPPERGERRILTCS